MLVISLVSPLYLHASIYLSPLSHTRAAPLHTVFQGNNCHTSPQCITREPHLSTVYYSKHQEKSRKNHLFTDSSFLETSLTFSNLLTSSKLL